MTIMARTSDDGKMITLIMPERFDFDTHTDFRKSYKDKPAANQYVIDMKNTTFMDSSALGMLLQLRQRAGGTNSAVRITNADANVMEILRIANFGKMMIID